MEDYKNQTRTRQDKARSEMHCPATTNVKQSLLTACPVGKKEPRSSSTSLFMILYSLSMMSG
jgi:hypothetical protein